MDEEIVMCPYNKAHHVIRRRLIPHLIKCRLSYPDVELLKCPYNASHLIPEPEFTHHVSTCKDKAIIDQYKYSILPIQLDPEDRQKFVVECDENWDDTEVIDYDPKKYIATANVIRKHIGNLKSVRKQFRKDERKRLGDLDSSDEDVPNKEDDKVTKNVRKRVYEDLDCKEKQETSEYKWFDDLAPSSSFTNTEYSKQIDHEVDSYDMEYAGATPLEVVFKKKQDEYTPYRQEFINRKEAVVVQESCNDSYRIEYPGVNPLQNYPPKKQDEFFPNKLENHSKKELCDPIDSYLKRRIEKNLQKKLECDSDEEPYDPLDDYPKGKLDEESPKKLKPCDPIDDYLKRRIEKNLQNKLEYDSDEEPYDPEDDFPLGNLEVESPKKEEHNSDEEPYDPEDEYPLGNLEVGSPKKEEHISDEEPYDPEDDYPLGSQEDEDSPKKQENNSEKKAYYSSEDFKKRMQDKVSTLRSDFDFYEKPESPTKPKQDEDPQKVQIEEYSSNGDSFSWSYEYTRSVTGMFSGLRRNIP